MGTDGHLYSNSSKVFSTSYAPEAYLQWGGKNFSGSWGPIDAAMVPNFAANRFAFLPASAITSEYSTDGGSTWTATTGSAARENIFANGGGFYIGNSAATKVDKKNYKCRITITTSGVVYTALNKFAIKITTNGSTGCHVKIESRTKANQDAGTNTWVTNCERAELKGWSGWNIVNVSPITTHGNNSEQYSQVRFTFGVDAHASTVTYAGLQVLRIMAFGGEGWTTPSNMATDGHLYSYDAAQNATFPAALNTVGQLKENGTRVSKVGHSHTVTHTPSGSVTFTGSTATTSAASNSTVASSSHTHTVTSTGDYTPAGTISAPTFTGKAKASGGPSATTTVASSSHTHTVTSTGAYTPAGSVAAPTFTGSAATSGGPSATTSVYSITTLPSLNASIANNCMTFSWTAAARSSVTVPTYNHTHSVTAKGSNSAPAFTGTAATLSVSGTTATPSATATVPTYNHTHSVTASGTIAAPTFTGTAATLSVSGTSGGPSATVSVAAASHKHTVTANGSASFTGTTATITTSASTN